METVKAMEKVMQLVVLHPFVLTHQKAKLTTQRHKKHKTISENFLCLLCLFVASFLLRGEFSFLFVVKTFLIFLEPGFEIL